MFGRNHYVSLARTMRDSKPDSVFDLEAWKKVVYNLAHDLGEDNVHFDKKRFYRDCDMPPLPKKEKKGS